MITETTNVTDKERRGWVLYDGQCALCIRLAGRFRSLLNSRGFGLAPLQSEALRQRLDLPRPSGEPLSEMCVLMPDGKFYGGADGLLELAGEFWWACPLRGLARVPGMRGLMRKCYRGLAARRHCFNGACRAVRR